jgi:hypothetical protein
MTETLTARDFLQRAIQTMNDRGKQYDSPGGERSMGKAVEAFNAIVAIEARPQAVASNCVLGIACIRSATN